MITDGLKHITALLFLGMVLGFVALAALYLFAHFTQRPGLARTAAWLGLGGAGVYAGLLLIASISSHDRVLAPGEEKHICELDCHLAYSVAGVKAEPLPDGQMRHTVTVKIRFDKETISNRRALDLALSPNSRRVALVDAQGRTFPGSADGLRQRLVPGESYTTDIVFDVPANAGELRLILRSNDIPTPFIIGHENSIFHGKTTFALGRES